MAKKGSRVQVIMECTEHKTNDQTWYQSLYHHRKNKKNTPERLGLKKENLLLKRK